MQVSYRWRPIADLPEDLRTFADSELEALRKVWIAQRESLRDSGSMETFLEKLVREYAIEGGLIERAYTLDRGITTLLIDRGIDASLIPQSATNKDPQHVARTILAHKATIEWVFELVSGNRVLSTSIIRELHAALMEHEHFTTAIDPLGRIVEVELLKGEYKRVANNPMRPDGSIHEYCPPEHTASEMDRLLLLHQEHTKEEVHAGVEAAWLHHAFTQIHPFQDGNGRIARLLASYVFLKANYFTLNLTDALDREKYIDALETADQGDLRPLLQLCGAVQRRTFLKVQELFAEVRREQEIGQIIQAARDRIASRQQQEQGRIERAKESAKALHAIAAEQLQEVAESLTAELSPVSPGAEFRVDGEPAGGSRGHFYRFQVGETAKSLGYSANTTLYHSWARLVLKAGDRSELLISFHGVGHEFRGVLAASITFWRKLETGEEQSQVSSAPAALSVFQINYEESLQSLRDRFEPWLKRSLTSALAMWQSSL